MSAVQGRGYIGGLTHTGQGLTLRKPPAPVTEPNLGFIDSLNSRRKQPLPSSRLQRFITGIERVRVANFSLVLSRVHFKISARVVIRPHKRLRARPGRKLKI